MFEDDKLTKEELDLMQDQGVPGALEEPSQSKPPETPELEPEPGPADEKDYKYLYEQQVKATQEARFENRETRKRLEQITDRIMQAQEKRELESQASPAEKPPDYETDPIGYLKWENEQIRKQVQQTQVQTKEQSEYLVRQNQHEQIMGAYKQATELFKTRVAPDYDDARDYLMRQREADLRIMGIDDPGLITQSLQLEEADLVRRAFANRHNPAELIYKVAQNRGYTGKGSDGGEGRQGLSFEAPTPGAPKSLSNIRGNLQKPQTLQGKVNKIMGMSDKEIFNLPDDALDAILKQLPG